MEGSTPVEQFVPPSDRTQDAAPPRAARASFFLQANVSVPGSSRPFAVRVRNLSAGGMMADCDRPLTVGDRLEVELRGVDRVHGTVAWVRAGRIGVSFDTAIDPQQARKPVTRPIEPRERPASHVAGLFNSRLQSR